MIKAAVCDDEETICDFLQQAITQELAKADLDGSVTVFDDGEPLAKLYEAGNADFDIILLDITMKNCDGMTAAKRIRQVDSEVMIVFVTASAEYVFSGYEVRAFRYILKPELLHGFSGVFRECLNALTKADDAHFTFQKSAETVSIPLRDILYFESNRRVITVHLSSGGSHSFYSKLDTIAEQLSKHDFVRCHQSFLVNAKKIASVKGSRLILTTQEVLPVSKHRSKETNDAVLWAMR